MAPVLWEPMVKRNIPQNEQIFNHVLTLQKSALLHRCVLDVQISVNTVNQICFYLKHHQSQRGSSSTLRGTAEVNVSKSSQPHHVYGTLGSAYSLPWIFQTFWTSSPFHWTCFAPQIIAIPNTTQMPVPTDHVQPPGQDPHLWCGAVVARVALGSRKRPGRELLGRPEAHVSIQAIGK